MLTQLHFGRKTTFLFAKRLPLQQTDDTLTLQSMLYHAKVALSLQLKLHPAATQQ